MEYIATALYILGYVQARVFINKTGEKPQYHLLAWPLLILFVLLLTTHQIIYGMLFGEPDEETKI